MDFEKIRKNRYINRIKEIEQKQKEYEQRLIYKQQRLIEEQHKKEQVQKFIDNCDVSL
jgi:parvulin-like peptidyl-prolyl isomerase